MKRTLCAACWLVLVAPAAARGQEGAPARPDESAPGTIALPYGFYDDGFGVAGAYVYARDGFPQKQSLVLATGMVGITGTGLFHAMARDLLVPGFDRLFADPVFSLAYYHGNYAYVSGNPGYPSERAGANGSARGDYVTGTGWDEFFRVSFRYLLPIGWGRDHVGTQYRLDGGLLDSGATGGGSLNPVASGATFVGLRPFYRSQTLDSSGMKVSQRTNGLDVSLTWDNRDYVPSPSVGQSITLRWSRDFGRLDSTGSWTALAGELDQYLSLGPSEHFRQRVLALDVWTASSPSWSERADGRVVHRPPTFEGASLGGIWRMRGYRIERFSDKAALCYGAEYRMIPRWNPFPRWRWLQDRVGVEWIQLVPFAELGRVAPSWDLGELHSSMKWDAGLGVRVLAKGLVVRVDVAASPEGPAVQMMVGQPFQF
jgi:hypothetical protein